MNKIQIINDLLPGAFLSYKKYNILPSLTIAQAILETGWLDHVKGNNIYGIKWTAGCGYEVQEFSTHEFINGINTPMVCKFRKYDSIGDSLLDHGKLLTMTRYKSVIASKDYKEAALNIYKSGYCTDAEYTSKLISIIEQNKLYIYDAQPIGNSSSSNDSENIKYFQSCLTKMKIKDINNNNLVVDGSNGPLTASAVKKFQNIVGITSDGICGTNTINAIQIIMKRPSCSIYNPGNKIVVRYLQYRTQSNIDGAFGPDTERCIKTYQKNNELVADGIVGNCSWKRLLA